MSLVPDYKFKVFSDASAEFLSSIGVKGIVLDIDNTLEPYEHPDPGEHVIKWLSELREAGISAAIVSNNGGERVERFNKDLKLPAYYKAKKPFKRNVLNALSDMGVERSEAILMGDQVFTDVWAARNAKIRAILVPPINDKRDIFTRFKRLLEKPILRKYERKRRRSINDQT